jgi:cytochrome oxidase assembly protein ShyY1
MKSRKASLTGNAVVDTLLWIIFLALAGLGIWQIFSKLTGVN